MSHEAVSHEPPLSVRLLAWVAALELDYWMRRGDSGYSTHFIAGHVQDIRAMSRALKRLGVAHITTTSDDSSTLTIKYIWTPGDRA